MKTNFRTVYVAEMLTLLTSHNFLGGKKDSNKTDRRDRYNREVLFYVKG